VLAPDRHGEVRLSITIENRSHSQFELSGAPLATLALFIRLASLLPTAAKLTLNPIHAPKLEYAHTQFTAGAELVSVCAARQ
jgi:hypothetical protein